MATERPLESVVERPILVTGATGFIGTHLVNYLLARDRPVAILVRENYGMGDPLPPPLQSARSRLQVVYADLRNYRLTARAVAEAEPEFVVHLAAAGVTNPFLPLQTALRHNLTGTLNLLQACFQNAAMRRPARLVVARTPGEEEALNVYAASKAAVWQICRMYARTSGWPINGAMIFQAYGPGQPAGTLIPDAFAAARAGQDFPMTAGEQRRDWIYVGDVARGLEAMLTAELEPGETVDLGTGHETSVIAVVEQIYERFARGGRPLPGALPARPGEVALQVADAGRSAALLGWRAEIGLAAGLQMVRESWQ